MFSSIAETMEPGWVLRTFWAQGCLCFLKTLLQCLRRGTHCMFARLCSLSHSLKLECVCPPQQKYWMHHSDSRYFLPPAPSSSVRGVVWIMSSRVLMKLALAVDASFWGFGCEGIDKHSQLSIGPFSDCACGIPTVVCVWAHSTRFLR